MIPLAFLAMAGASDGSDLTPSQEMWQRFQNEFPEQILEETLGLTSYVQQVLGARLAAEAMLKIIMSEDLERIIEWRTCWEYKEWPVWAEYLKESITSKEILDFFSSDPITSIRSYVAESYHTPSETLRKLSKDKNWYILVCVAGNGNTPFDCLEDLSYSEEESIVAQIACNSSTPRETLERLCRSDSSEVRTIARSTLRSMGAIDIP